MIYHTVVRIVVNTGLVQYKRIEDDYYVEANYYEKYYTNPYSYPDVTSALVVNQFKTEVDDSETD